MNLEYLEKMNQKNLNENNIDCERVGIKQFINQQLYFANVPFPFHFLFY